MSGKTDFIVTQSQADVAQFWSKYEDTGMFSVTRVPNGKNDSIKTRLNIDINMFVDFVAELFHPVTFNKILYIYDDVSGIFIEDKGYLKSWIQSAISYKIAENDVELGEFSKYNTHNSTVRDIYDSLKNYNVVQDFPFNKFNGIPVENGVVAFDNEYNPHLEHYTPKHMFNHKLAVSYNPNASTDAINAILKSWYNEYEYLIQIVAQALWQKLPGHTPLKTAYMLIGSADAGKSTYLSHLLVERIFGKDNVSDVSLDELDERFALAEIADKYLNVCDDMNHISCKGFKKFKKISGSKTHKVERKYQEPYNAEITAVHVFSTNRPPEVDDETNSDDAFWSRWAVLYFYGRFPRMSKWVNDNLNKENVEGFFLMAIQYLKSFFKAEGKLPKKQELDEVVDLWKYNASPIHEFLEMETERDISGSIGKEELFSAIIEWGEEKIKGLTLKEQADFRTRLPNTITALSYKLKCEEIEIRRIGPKNKREWKYAGIKWKRESRFNPIKTVDGHL